MTGMLVPVLIPAWVAFCAWVSHRVGELFVDNPLRPELKALIFLALLPTLVVDELLGKAEFDRVCADRALVTLHASNLAGRRADFTEAPAEPVAGLLLPMQLHKHVLVDHVTRLPLVSFNTLESSGGKLARALHGRAAEPLTFTGRCEPPHWQATLDALGIKAAGTSRLGGPERPELLVHAVGR